MTHHCFRFPEAVVETDWLAAHLSDPGLRVFDCTTYLEFTPEEGRPYDVVSGHPTYVDGHIPGAGYLDLQGAFSNPDAPFAMSLPSIEEAVRAFEMHGVSDGTRVVLFSRTTLPWATRFWWMLRWIGFDNAAILNGGFAKWQAEGRPVEKGENRYAAGMITPRPRPEIFVGKEEVLAGTDAAQTCVVNALSPDLHSGENDRYGRAGRIPGSVNVPAASVVEAESQILKPYSEIAAAFEASGASGAARQITYCGGGIFATLDAFLLHQLGCEDVAVYDNSMSEWANDRSLPMESD
ncbi:sulfurtransferase [Shimia sp. W99]